MKRKYHGWIYSEKSTGMKDFFTVQWSDELGSHSKSMGYGELGATNSVDFFENGRRLGHIWLEKTPLGLRVYTEEE